MSIDAPETANGQVKTEPVRVKFGPGKTQEIPHPWAEFMLTTMHQRQKDGQKPLGFGELLQLAAMDAS